MNNDYHNSNCKFADELVSYLYSEIDEREKISFEAHLPSCASCTGEISSFSLVRSGIQEWRAQDFANLATPSFTVSLAESPRVNSISWLDSIRAYFSLSRVWIPAAAAIAVLIISVVLYKTAINIPQEKIVAEKEKSIIKDETPVLPIGENVNQIPEIPKDNDQRKPSISSPKPELADAAINPVKKANVKSPQPASFNKLPSKFVNKSLMANYNQAVPKSTKKVSPSLTAVDDDEEDSLRLSDIFKEVSMK